MAWYDTGTVAVHNGSTTVTGSGTNFSLGAQIGEGFLAPDDKLYEIATITSATVIVLADSYLGSTETGQTYKIVPTQSLVANLAGQVTSLISDYATVKDGAGAGKFNSGTASNPSLTFEQDQDTGLFRKGPNELGVTVGGVEKVAVKSTGIDVTGNVIATGTLSGSNGTTGEIQLGKGTALTTGAGTYDTSVRWNGSSGNLLFSQGAVEKMRIGNSGIDVTGAVTADGLVADGSVANNTYDGVTLSKSGSVGIISGDRTGGNYGSLSLRTTMGAAPLERMEILHNGDISFYEDTGTTAKFFWDASAESLGIGTTAVIGGLENTNTGMYVSGTGGTALSIASAQSNLTFAKVGAVGSGQFANFAYNGGTIGHIGHTATATSYNTSSDHRLKTDVQPMTGATATFMQLNPVSFEWRSDGTRVDGFLAHELQAVIPASATGTHNGMMDEEYQATPATGDIFTAGSEAGYNEVSPEVVGGPAYYDIDGVQIRAEIIAEPAVHEAFDAVAEVIHSSDVEQPETLEDGQAWRETTPAVMATRSVPDYQGIDQSKVVPLITATIQELIARIEVLEGE